MTRVLYFLMFSFVAFLFPLVSFLFIAVFHSVHFCLLFIAFLFPFLGEILCEEQWMTRIRSKVYSFKELEAADPCVALSADNK